MYKPLFNKREVLVFRQFQRKGYSLFACLGREVVISVLSVATLSSAKAAGISDEVWRADSVPTNREVKLDDVTITGSRAPLTLSQAARMVTVLSREEIAQAPVQSINDLLKYAVGVDVRQRGVMGTQTDISMRGGTQEQIIVLLNGINICDPQTGHNVMDLPVDLSEIVRIEVLEGPAGRTYGTSSLVGAINIVTSPTKGSGSRGFSGEAQIEGGSFGYVKGGVVLRTKTAAFANSLSGSYGRSDGYSHSASGHQNTDYRGGKAFYQGSYDDEQVQLGWYAGLADKGWGSSTFYASPKWQADNQYEHTMKLLTAIQGHTKQGFVHFRPSLYFQQHRDRYEGYRGEPEKMKYNYNRCNVYGANLTAYFDWMLGRTAFGGELRNEDLVSGNLGEPLREPQHISGTDRDYTLGINRTNLSAYIEHNILLRRFTLSAGLIAAKSSWSTGGWRLYPGVDASYTLPFSQSQLKLFASYNTSLRLPSFTEMYYKLQGYAADPHLKPEEMQAVEVGAELLTPAVQGKLSLYHHHGKNMIDWIMDTSEGQQAEWKSVNHTKINANGVEASVALDLKTLFALKVSPSAVYRLKLSYNYINQDKVAEANIVSQYALEYLKHKLVANAQATLWRQLVLGVNLRWQDRVGTYTNFSGEVKDYKPFALLDAKLAWNARRYDLYAEVNNVLNNRSYVDYGNVPQPGIWVVVGGRLRF